ncbi:MAG: DUF721 domain-containing protein [Dysgonamonadaceae bacterium]|jgi:predicted nucleic acid-binding Zn ribbon protein|nr:DUF721 domain-containing protein [Dysgonamonadaceae bacterium]MDD3308407.1 DUF721 domain-containing protein [Dysgonamonadaceae bacterium]MDD3900171.1 DUF721 domain-containing protein [Dysgonamonadaceae bacterium]MDD4398899.1 DUF721 domain-containing protein [Dysgonamonadaceae bacterium]MEA5081024.1 DUF721 domain-containing protein [Dysgonamonadaceae bacterium]
MSKMIKKYAKPMKDLLSEYLDENSELKIRIAENRVTQAWYNLFGESIAAYTKSVYFRKNTLYVQLSSSVLRAELQLNKKNLIAKLNEIAQIPIVREIVLR